MNRRQKKKQYKKNSGHNPQKGWKVTAGGITLKKGGMVVTEETIERMAEILRTGFAAFGEALASTAEGMAKLFQSAADSLRESDTRQQSGRKAVD